MRGARGFTLAETIVSIFILGLMLSALAALAGPIIHAPAASSAKGDTIMSAAYGLDALERDLRQSDDAGVWACTVASVVTCTQPTSLTVSPYVAVLTAYDSNGVFQTDASGPIWQAYVVYSQPAGSSIIYRTYQTWSAKPANWQDGAVNAVTAASALPAGTTVAIPTAQSLSIDINQLTNTIDLQLTTASTSGTASNSTAYSTTILARN